MTKTYERPIVPYTKVFVYGTLMAGRGNSFFLQTAKLLGRAVTKEKEFTMYDGIFPCVVRGGSTPIFGEVYEVDYGTFDDLDRLEGHPHLFRREPIKVVMPDGEETTAFIYIYQRNVTGKKEIETGAWK